MRFTKFLLLFVILITIDVLYLGVIQKQFISSFFKSANNSNQLNLKWVPGLIAWALLAFGLYYFVLSRPGWTWKDAAILGLVIYGVYDMTNLATLSKWTWNFAIADMIWGAVLMVLVALIYKKIN